MIVGIWGNTMKIKQLILALALISTNFVLASDGPSAGGAGDTGETFPTGDLLARLRAIHAILNDPETIRVRAEGQRVIAEMEARKRARELAIRNQSTICLPASLLRVVLTTKPE